MMLATTSLICVGYVMAGKFVITKLHVLLFSFLGKQNFSSSKF